MEEGKLLRGVDGEGGDGEGERGGGRSREAGESIPLLPLWGRKQLPHLSSFLTNLQELWIRSILVKVSLGQRVSNVLTCLSSGERPAQRP